MISNLGHRIHNRFNGAKRFPIFVLHPTRERFNDLLFLASQSLRAKLSCDELPQQGGEAEIVADYLVFEGSF